MKRLVIYFLMGLLITGCKQAYDSPVQSSATGYLVIEGVINSGPGTAALTLSRTTPLDKRTVVYETGAKVKLEGDNSSIYTLTEKTNGVYSADNLNLNTNARYRLRINVKTGKEYLSDFVTVKNNPPIDSLSFKRENGDGIQLYINTHDAKNNTRYYQWAYDETWQIQSIYASVLKYKIVTGRSGDSYSVVYKDSTTFSSDPSIVNCWQFFSSNTLTLGSTAKLENDIVNLPIAFINHASIKLSVLYSINVKQYTWDKNGYEFLDRMRKNTEATGSIFDAQPSELKGNIRCVSDSTEPVIGYFNVCPFREKRFFISSSQAPNWGYNSGCYSKEIANTNKDIMEMGLGLMPATVTATSATGAIISFEAAPPECVDCTLRGTNKRPSYWP